MDKEKTEKRVVINMSTGEVETEFESSRGYSVISWEEKERRAKAKEKRIQQEMYRRGTKEKFFFVKSDMEFEMLSPATLTRLIYLNTYSNYNGVLMSTQRKAMARKELQAVLGLAKTATDVFWKEVSPQYVREDEDGKLLVDRELFLRGRMRRKQYRQFQQFYDTGLRRLYEAVNSRKHKQLGYIFMLLPFVNLEYNLICHNPEETDLDKVDLMSLSEFCERVHYAPTHIDRLLQIYDGITFEVNGKQEKFCTITYNGINRGNAKICVNPNIFYVGNNFECVKILGAFCRD